MKKRRPILNSMEITLERSVTKTMLHFTYHKIHNLDHSGATRLKIKWGIFKAFSLQHKGKNIGILPCQQFNVFEKKKSW